MNKNNAVQTKLAYCSLFTISYINLHTLAQISLGQLIEFFLRFFSRSHNSLQSGSNLYQGHLSRWSDRCPRLMPLEALLILKFFLQGRSKTRLVSSSLIVGHPSDCYYTERNVSTTTETFALKCSLLEGVPMWLHSTKQSISICITLCYFY